MATLMKCPKCGTRKSQVTDSRSKGTHIRRRRKCLGCGRSFVTVEVLADTRKRNLADVFTSLSEDLKVEHSRGRDRMKFLEGEVGGLSDEVLSTQAHLKSLESEIKTLIDVVQAAFKPSTIKTKTE